MIYPQDSEVEKREILKRYRTLLRLWKPRNPIDKKVVRKAFKMALEAHKDMRRKTGEPYIYHPLSVATIAVGEIGLGATSIICALLHDVVEDTDYNLEDIRGLFGDKVAAIIDGLTKIKGIFDQNTSSILAENFKKVLLTLSDDVRVILIKLADRLHNMRTLHALPHEKRLKISSETTYLYAPLAHRLGLHAIKSELEDLALKYTEPDVYGSITQKLKESAKSRSLFVEAFTEPIKKALSAKGFIFEIHDREKSVAAIWDKMQKKDVSFEEIYDIFAIRIIIDSPVETEKSDCWKVYSAVTDFYRPNNERLRDWISIPKSNGYEALHTTVMSWTGQWVEIQIRSRRMDDIAEKGYAAHWKYKEAFNINSRLDNWLDRIKEMINSPDTDAVSFIDDVKGFFFHDEISVFTPQGELRALPAGSSVLDFAYAIHSQLGDTCIGAKVDKKLMPATYILRNGQQVEIITSMNQTPREEWLRTVVTTRAKTSIKLALRAEKRKVSKAGKEKLEQWFNKIGLELSNDAIRKFQTENNFHNLIDLFYAVSVGTIGFKDVKLFAVSKVQDGRRKPGASRSPKRALKRETEPAGPAKFNAPDAVKHQEGKPIFSDDHQVAACCNPIPGDEVIGLITSELLPIEIHRTKCLKAQELMTVYGNSIIKVDWANRGSITFIAEIKVEGIDRQGMTNEITSIISGDMNLNIKSFHIDALDGITECFIALYVKNTAILYDVLKKLDHLDGITLVKRIN
ncbi:MAG: RelA/SpoT family protein [Bacteroidales bacterium]|nr:RelA/SpoT family protein [Bacteroidales bacterium]